MIPTGFNKELEDRIAELEGTLDEILKANSLTTAKEIAADVLDVDVDDYLIEDLDLEELEFGDFPSEDF